MSTKIMFTVSDTVTTGGDWTQLNQIGDELESYAEAKDLFEETCREAHAHCDLERVFRPSDQPERHTYQVALLPVVYEVDEDGNMEQVEDDAVASMHTVFFEYTYADWQRDEERE